MSNRLPVKKQASDILQLPSNELFLAFLVCNRAGRFASRLAGSLALTTAAFCSSLLQVCTVQSFDVFHFLTSLTIFSSAVDSQHAANGS